jgi:hypothetical protein
MPRPLTQKRFKSRREAERALAEIIRDGGRPGDFTIDANPRGECLILIHETGTGRVAGWLGA